MSQNRDERIDLALKKLWSPDEEERKTGKKELLEVGTNSIEPLVSLLSDLLNNPYPRFPTGHEEEGTRAVDHHKKWSQRLMSPEEIDRSIELRRKLFINTRLIYDVVYLLGQLRAEEAIPILLKILEGRNMYSEPDTFGCELEALEKIGRPAVPYLISAIREAKGTAEKQNDVHLGSVMHFDDGDSLPNNEDKAGIDWREENEELERDEEINFRIRRIQSRSLRILGAIRDPSALPFLRNLLSQAADERLIIDVRAAIERITNSTDSSSGKYGEGMSPRSMLQDGCEFREY